MKNFSIDVDITMSKHFVIEAENEEKAKAMVSSIINAEPYYHASHSDAYVGHEITDVIEKN